MDVTTNIGLSKPDYNAIADIEVINNNSDTIDAQFSPNKWVKTVNGVAPVNHNVTVDTGVTSFNGQTGAVTYNERSVKQLIDIIYPVGCYFDTTDTSFNPNASWAGTTWEKVTDGRALIAGGSTYNIGTNYGDATHKLTVNELPSHSHSASSSTAGNHSHTRGTMNIKGVADLQTESGVYSASGAFSGTKTNGKGGYGDSVRGNINMYLNFDASNGWTGETSYNGNHSHTISIGNTGSNVAFSLLPPSKAVARWHRLA